MSKILQGKLASSILVMLFTIMVSLIVLYNSKQAERIAKYYSPLIDAAMEIKLEAAIAHLWFEEIVSGDTNITYEQVMMHIDASIWYTNAMLHGGENDEGHFLPIEDAELRQSIKETQTSLKDFRKVSETRWLNRDNSGIGSDIDQEFDAIFYSFIAKADTVETVLQNVMKKDQHSFANMQRILLFFILLMGVFTSIIYYQNGKKQRETAEKIKENSSRMKSLLDNRGDSIWSLDLDYNYIIFNEPYAKIILDEYGVVLQRGMNAFEVQAPEIQGFWKSKYEPVFRGETVVFEFTHQLNEREEYFQVTLNPIVSDGIVTGASALSVNITDAKKNQLSILEREKQFRSLIEQSGDAMFLVDLNGNFINVNKRACEALGYERDELIKLNISDVDVNNSSSFDLKELYAGLVPGKSLTLETQHKRKSGELLAIEVKIGLYEYGNTQAILQFARDITERKAADLELEQHRSKLEDIVKERTESLAQSQEALLNLVDDLNIQSVELEKSNAQFAALNKELESFSYSVSHDLRAPLRGIDGFSLALLEDYSDVLDAEGKNYLNRVRLGSQKMALLIDEMLNLSRLGRMSLKPRTVALSDIVQSISDDFVEYNQDRTIKLIIAKELTCFADPTLIRVVLQNLLENAFKFTSKRQIAKIEFGILDNEGKRTYFVKDNGAGFNMEYKNKLFTAFQRLHQESEFPGTGIGLTTVQRIINRHNGELWAEGEIDNGATFYFTINL